MAAPQAEAAAPSLSGNEGTYEQKILRTCSSGDLPTLQRYFSELGITQGHPLIYYALHHQLRPSEPPPTYQMVEAAVSAQQPTILSYLLTTFSTVAIDKSIVTLAIEHASVPVFAELLAHDRSVMHLQWNHGMTPLASACFASKTALALYLINQGADVNEGVWLRLSTLELAVSAKQRSTELIRALIEHGAETDSLLERWAAEDRVDDVSCLLEAGANTAVIATLLKRKEVRKNRKIVALLMEKEQNGAGNQWSQMIGKLKRWFQ
jgi:hypothetical protein